MSLEFRLAVLFFLGIASSFAAIIVMDFYLPGGFQDLPARERTVVSQLHSGVTGDPQG